MLVEQSNSLSCMQNTNQTNTNMTRNIIYARTEELQEWARTLTCGREEAAPLPIATTTDARRCPSATLRPWTPRTRRCATAPAWPATRPQQRRQACATSTWQCPWPRPPNPCLEMPRSSCPWSTTRHGPPCHTTRWGCTLQRQVGRAGIWSLRFCSV